MLSYLLALMLASSATAAHCSVAHLRACPDTNRLVWAKDFRPALTRFLGRHAQDRIDYLYKGQLVLQIEDVLGGPPDDRRTLADGSMLFTACRPHSCPEKGAVAFDAAGRIIVAAIVSFRPIDRADARGRPTLDVYVRDPEASAVARAAIAVRAKTETDGDARVFHQAPLAGPVLHLIR